ncbi:flavin-containing monooxygenase [Arthrobacter russicus]|uniref:Cation diffusion facilitator CzcD-associated flavoprotein CzcO n=1 Tax=Arthrobacter russicus TaxID=172040 RepID=A0ABU1JF27_9MICC|nr:NAD(P)/FAD-dependent oxidoreductase [Arthrobacter russicus]MDR6271059.1 cation diffusion facilitator CzcD-associated flavoprotein CzcO [Arthrobacter russicus]
MPEASIEIAVIGAGFSGLGVACELVRHGRRDFIVLERGSTVGGTWRDNTYPGCACDIPSDLYSFSFQPNPHWSSNYAAQPEILAYLQQVAADYGLLEPDGAPAGSDLSAAAPGSISFGTELQGADWLPDRQRWRISTNRGSLLARYLISGHGPLITPKWPDLAGLDEFRGVRFHSAQWDHTVDLAGKRVAVIGTGASAIQFIPQVQGVAGEVHVFQRTPPWIVPRGWRETSAKRRAVFAKYPVLQKLDRQRKFRILETRHLGLSTARFNRVMQDFALSYLNRKVKDPGLRAKLTPDYRIGCKRILISDNYFNALQKPNVELVTDAVVRVTERGIVTADGVEREADVLICGTGFNATQPKIAGLIRDGDGVSLAQRWGADFEAHRGTTVTGYPNLFLIVGPNTALGHNSIIYMIEAQVRYVLAALNAAERRGAVELAPTEAAQRAYNRWLQKRLARLVWTRGGCSSYYLSSTGKNTTLWPERAAAFRRKLGRFDAASYRFFKPRHPVLSAIPTKKAVSPHV